MVSDSVSRNGQLNMLRQQGLAGFFRSATKGGSLP
jgi:hypothetical protein